MAAAGCASPGFSMLFEGCNDCNPLAKELGKAAQIAGKMRCIPACHRFTQKQRLESGSGCRILRHYDDVAMPNASEELAIALSHQQAGRLPEAELGYRRILSIDPGNEVAWQFLGVVAFQRGDYDRAVQCIG